MALLVPIDLTAPSRSAVDLAARLGVALKEDVLLLHVSKTPPALDLLAELHRIAEPIRAAGVDARLRTARGDAASGIARVAWQRRVSWVVMGTHGPEHPRRDHTGSVASEVMRIAQVPVAAVRPGDPQPFTSTGSIVLVSPGQTDAASELARTLTGAQGAALRRYAPGEHDHTPLMQPDDGLPASAFGLAVVAYNPDCGPTSWCARALRDMPQPVVLVSGPAGSSRTCACRFTH